MILDLILNKYKLFEKNYLIVIGFSIFFIFFFSFPYVQLKFSEGVIYPIEVSLNSIKENTHIIDQNMPYDNFDLDRFSESNYTNSLHQNLHNVVDRIIALRIQLNNTEITPQLNAYENLAFQYAQDFHRHVWDVQQLKNSGKNFTIESQDLLMQLQKIAELRLNILTYIEELKNKYNILTNEVTYSVENLVTPFGTILLNFTYLLIIFPLGISIGFFVVLFQYCDIIDSLKNAQSNYKSKILKHDSTSETGYDFIKNRIPGLFDPVHTHKVIVALLIPSAIYLISVAIDYYIVFVSPANTINEISKSVSILFLAISGLAIFVAIVFVVTKHRNYG